MMIFLLLVSWTLWTRVSTQLNLYNTDANLDIGHLQVNCLHYYSLYTFDVRSKIEFCLGSTNDTNSSIDHFSNTRDQKFTFDELRELNVTSKDLLSWSASIDVAEQYQYYIDGHGYSSELDDVFFNCTVPWFGSRCQYSFDMGKTLMFRSIVTKTMRTKYQYGSSYRITNLTCYIHLKCDRGTPDICLDWREVCDGRIDCIDGGADEAECFDLEMNECNENEYRCHNGLCISSEFVNDDIAHCLDHSDELLVDPCPYSLPNRAMLTCHDLTCVAGNKKFSCGDGQCVTDFDTCYNKRHLLLSQSMITQGNLSYSCWMAMVCLTKIIDRINETSCEHFLKSANISIFLETCETLTQFPTIPVLFGHVRFLYRLKDVHDFDIDLSLIPDYVCYDEQLCDFLTPTFFNGSLTCQHSHEIGFDSTVKPENWTSLVRLIEPYFRKCLIKHDNNQTISHHSALYYCQNSTKFISKHRILDSISDCYLNDDEEQFELSCSINNVLRFRCENENKCYLPSLPRKICPPRYLLHFNEIDFQLICDRTIHLVNVMIDGQNHTDETDCERWPCNNYYTRCDGFWNCPYGEDEENCTRQICPSGYFACGSLYNYTLICLSADRVSDGVIDCLGAADESQHCRRDLSEISFYKGFRCWNDTKCVTTGDLCDKRLNCPFEDDEAFCGVHDKGSSKCNYPNITDVEEAVCRIGSVERIRFSLAITPTYPPYESTTNELIVKHPIRWRNIMSFATNEPDDPSWPWRCNQGLYVRLWMGDNNFSYKCFCPPTYYGDICQYQNQRVILTLKLTAIDERNIRTIVVTLFDDDDDFQEINSYQQFTNVPTEDCRNTFTMHLTYSTRPKNISKNYSVRIDVFDRTYLIYAGSWYFRIPFLFLPVYRMAVVLTVPNHPAFSLNSCPIICHNSECMKYMNEEKFFCRCHTGWSGARCDIPVSRHHCSSDSIYVGMIHNRSICVCPLHKGGPRCLLTFLCPRNFCHNNGQCVVLHDNMDQAGHVCMCPKQFYGLLCDHRKNILEISFDNIKSSPFLLIYIFDYDYMILVSGRKPKVIAQKVTMFQRTVTLYVASDMQLVFVRIDDDYYLAVLQRVDRSNISTSIDNKQRCVPVNDLLSSQLLSAPQIRQIKYYHLFCQTHHHLTCFYDQSYMCLCTTEHHANCFKFEQVPPKCRENIHCQNGAECLQDEIQCPSTIMCKCTDCFYGDRCQFYAKGIGLTLDDILRYEIRPNTTIHNQTSALKWSSAFTVIMLVLSFINSILSILTFRIKDSLQVGCGLYLLASSIISFLAIGTFTFKFWFLVLTQINSSNSDFVLRAGCQSIEFILKLLLYTNNWLDTCIALERSVTVYKGVQFNKMLSKRIARWVIFLLPLLVMVSIIHDPFYRNLFDDIEEKRLWCVFLYSGSIQNYNTFILFFHQLGPFCANLISALYIIFGNARQRAVSQTSQTYFQHLSQQFKDHKNIIISPIVLVVLSLPRLIISFLSKCVREPHDSTLYLAGYFVSFIPSISSFIVYVLPSVFYRKQFQKTIKTFRRRVR